VISGRFLAVKAGFDSITPQVEIVMDTVAVCQVFLLVQSLLHLSGLIGDVSHPYMQKIRIIGFFFLKIGYFGSLKWKKISAGGCFRLRILLRTNKTLIRNSLHLFDNWGKI
jgi:hypothetical protein